MRSTRRLTPTDAGQTYYERARRAIAEAEAADLAARGADAHLTGRLRVSAGVTFTTLHLVPRMATFLAAHPRLWIDLVLDDGPIDLIEEGADIGLHYGPLSDSGLVGRKIATARQLVVGTPDYFDRVGVPMAPAELMRHQAVILTGERGGGANWMLRNGASEATVTISGPLRVSSSEGVRAAVLSGFGLAIACEWMFAPELATGAVCAVLTEWALPGVELWVVFPTGRLVNAKARAFTAFVEQAMSKNPSPLE